MKKKLQIKVLAVILGAALLAGGCGNGKGDYIEDSSASMSGAGSSSVRMDSGSENGMWESSDEAQFAGEETAGEMKAEDETDTALGGTEAAGQNQNDKLIYTYSYSVETKEFDAFTANITKKVQELGGYVENSETNGNAADGANRYANMTLRIPADKMNQMLSMVKEEANVVYDNVSSENVTLRYVDMKSHVEALRTEQKTLLRLIEKADNIEDVIALQSQLTQVRYEIESYESQLRTLDNLVDYSTLHLDISEVDRTTTVANRKATFGEEINNLFSDNLYAVGQWLRSFAIWLIGSLPVLVPLAVIIIIAVRLARKWRKRRKERMPALENSSAGSYRSIYQEKKEDRNDQEQQDVNKEG